MSSDAYAREERWIPLPAPERKWETSTSARVTQVDSPSTASSNSTSPPTGPRGEGGKLKLSRKPEEVYAPVMPSNLRPAAPKLKEEHVWGVREDCNESRPLSGSKRAQRSTKSNEDGQ